jgi:GTPase SAR1 family protein
MAEAQKKEKLLKILVIGDYAVGKVSLCQV